MTATSQILVAHAETVALVILFAFVPLFILFTLLARSDYHFPLRPIRVYDQIRRLAVQSTETGRPLHVSLGSGAFDRAVPEIVAGLTVFDYVSQQAARSDQDVIGTTGSPIALLAAMNLLQANRAYYGYSASYRGGELRFFGPDPQAYAAGTAAESRMQPQLAHLLLGYFRNEGLWLAEALQYQGAPVLGGTSDPAAVALMQLPLDQAVIGEDLFAGGAYLHRPQHLGSLAAQDWMRFLIVAAMVVGVILVSLGYGG